MSNPDYPTRVAIKAAKEFLDDPAHDANATHLIIVLAELLELRTRMRVDTGRPLLAAGLPREDDLRRARAAFRCPHARRDGDPPICGTCRSAL